ncbi:MAG: 4'-phosphopantetheinyl transferase superfamily protein [Oscillospiraceae bacterium]|nr:4'-phosphopantetheinyl transferase superfamily protein [Oscillospiraceae bacterium]
MYKLDYWPLNGLDSRVAGKLLLKQMYEELTGEEMPPIEKAPRGKPYFPGSDLHFSITHTKTTVFCAVSDTEIGIDAEDLNRKVSPALAEKILSPGEYAQYEALPEEERNEALLRFWVLKEAEAKCSGLGLRGYPNHTEFDLDDPRVQKLGGCMVAVICAGEPDVEDNTEPREDADAL